MKLKFWQDEIARGDATVFSTLNYFLIESKTKFNDTEFKKDIKDHLAGLFDSFNKYYPPNLDISREDWIRDPFLARDLPAHLGELIDLFIDNSL